MGGKGGAKEKGWSRLEGKGGMKPQDGDVVFSR